MTQPTPAAAEPTRRAAGPKVVPLHWPAFLDHMREWWEPGKHGALIATTGEGKTTAAVGLLELRKWVLALDPKGEDDTLTASGYRRITGWPPPGEVREDIANGRPARLIIGGQARSRDDLVKLRTAMADAVEGARGEGGWTVYADEYQLLADVRMFALGHKIEELLITARTRGTSVLTSFQAPHWVPRAAVRQASFVAFWGTHDRGSIKSVAEAMGRDWRELEGAVDELPQFYLLVIPKQIREPMILTNPPKVA